MIKNSKIFIEFEKELLKKEKVDIMRNFRIVEALYDEAVALGVFPLKNPLDELNVDIKIARIINGDSRITTKNIL